MSKGDPDDPWEIPDCTFVCEVPPQLGAVTGFKQRDGKLYVTTESGIEMIVPIKTDCDSKESP